MTLDHSIFAYLAKEESYGDQDIIIKEGSRGDWVYVLLEGKAKVKKTTPRGMVTIDNLREGDIFGEMVLWQNIQEVRTASVIADGRVKVGVLDGDQLRRDYESVSPRLKSLIKSLIMRLKETTQKAVTMAAEAK